MPELSFPSSTIFNRRIPKTKFYEKASVDNEIRRLFIDQIESIVWRNKLSHRMFSIGVGSAVEEIEVFVIQLNQTEISPKILKTIDEAIPYPILFLLKHAGKTTTAICYKEINQNPNSVNVIKYFMTKPCVEADFTIELFGLDMDAIYQNFIKQVAGIDKEWTDGYTLKDQVDRIIRNERFDKEIAALRKKMKSENQFNRQVELHEEIKKLLKERGEKNDK